MKVFWASVVILLRSLVGAFADFQRLGCLSLAASLSFFTLLSFFPMVGLLLYVIGLFVNKDLMWFQFMAHYFTGFFQNFIPGFGAGIADEIRRVGSEQVVGWIGLLAFVWFSGLVFYEMDYAIHVVFGTARTRNPLISTLMSVAMLSLVEVLLVLSFIVTQVIDVVVSYAPSTGGIDVAATVASRFLLSYVLPFSAVFITVTCLYRYLPKNKPTWNQAGSGGLVLTLLWETAKHLFSAYLQNTAIYYNRMYGSLLVVVLFLIWVYYSAVLFLYGASVVHRLQQTSTK
jgi:membrane protein